MSSNDIVLEELLGTLNQQQRIAAEFDYIAALQVIAGPGTGKTKVLTSRVAYMLLKHNINPKDIIVTTFTNKAAKEMTDRLVNLLKNTDIRVNDLIIGTFHSICLRILARFGTKIGLEAGWRIVEEKEVDSIMNELIEKMPDQVRDYANSFERLINLCRPIKNGEGWAVHPQMVKKEISKLKSSAILPDEYKNDSVHDSALAYFYERYQAELRNINALDFDDLLMYTFRLLCKERCMPNIKHVFVDEFQDTNSIQMDLMFLLAKGNHHLSRGVTVVGDPDQSIYAFRNALSQNFEQMISKCPLQSSQVILVENYRSSQKILDTSETLIKQQLKGRTQRQPLKAQFDCEFAPVYTNYPVNFLQSPSMAKEILYLKALPELFSYNDFAILVRQRRQIKNIETALIEHRIPYKIIRGRAFWELKEIMSMLNLLRCVYSDNEKNSIAYCLTYPARGLGQTSIEKIKKIMDESEASPFETLKNILDGIYSLKLNSKGKSVIQEFIFMVQTCRKLFDAPKDAALEEIFDKLYQMSGMEYDYLHLDGKKKKEKVDADADAEPNYENSRHKNIKVLKNYFLGTKQLEELPNSQGTPTEDENNIEEDGVVTEPVTVQEHIRTFFNSLSLYTSDSSPSGDNEEQGSITISTIHGSKGLEWPVVFIPGCIEGIIPSIFMSDSKDDSDLEGSEEDDVSDKEGITKGASVKKSKHSEEALDEERRMFFVAQTRAKLLLYLSSVEEGSNPMFGGPSRFLTNDLMSTMVDEQKALASEANIKSLYASMGKNREYQSRKGFSYKILVKDYSKFIDSRRESMIWDGKPVRNLMTLNIKKNIKPNTDASTGFTTAAAALKMETQGRSFAPPYSPKKKPTIDIKHSLSPVKSYAPNSNIKRSPNSKRMYAPGSIVNESPTKANKVKGKCKPLKLTTNIPIPSMFAPSNTPQTHRVASTAISQNRIGTQNRISTKKIVATPITLNEVEPESPIVIKDEVESNRFKIEDTTAAEILHNPDDLIVDNRPIIATAKILADAIRKPTVESQDKRRNKKAGDKKMQKGNEGTLQKGKRRKHIKQEHGNENEHESVKNEPGASQFDIFSQLAKAKKKAKMNNGEIIIIDD